MKHVLELDHKQILHLDTLLDSVFVQHGLNEQNDLREGRVNVLPLLVLLLNEVAIPAGLVLLIQLHTDFIKVAHCVLSPDPFGIQA